MKVVADMLWLTKNSMFLDKIVSDTLDFIYSDISIRQVVFGITDELILVNPKVLEKYVWLSMSVLSFSAVFELTISRLYIDNQIV